MIGQVMKLKNIIRKKVLQLSNKEVYMPKFSIIIPVYNVEKYIKKCLDSVFNQTFTDYEVIIVNDGTKDKSMDIVKDYDLKVINQENKGLSAARNTELSKLKENILYF